MNKRQRPGRILAFRNDRLGARLITLINAMRLSQDHDLPLAVYWIKATDIGAVFNDTKAFFDADFVDRHFIDAEEWRAVRDDAVRIGSLEQGGIEAIREVLDSGRDVLVDAAFGLTVIAGEDPEHVRHRIADLLIEFPFAQALKPSIEEISRAVDGGTAYHIRRGDLISFPRAMHRSWPKKYVPDEIYMVHIEREIDAGARPIVFSDHAETIARFKAAYPQLLSASELFDVSHLSTGQRDLMELYAMSRCSKIIAPGQSAFSSTAADLGGARKVDVGEDLTPEQLHMALDRLSDRLAQPNGNDVIAREGDLGQSFVHVIDHLGATGRRDQAIASLGRHIEAGLNISFLYPRQLEQQIVAGDAKGALRTAAIMRDRILYHRADYAVGEVLHGIAHVMTGDRQRGLHHIFNGFWHEPDGVVPRTVVGLLIELGVLTASNFLPMTAAAQRLRRRMARDALGDPRFKPLHVLATDKVDAVTNIPGLEPITWDWGLFLRSFSSNSVARHPHREGYEKALGKLSDGPDANSLRAIYGAHCGRLDEAIETLTDQAADTPDIAMVQQRLSHALYLARDFKTSAVAAERAAALMPDVPALQVWRGMTAIRVKDAETAIAALRQALASGLAMPSIRGFLARAYALAGDRDAELAELDAAITDTPTEQQFRFERARLLHGQDRHEEALADMELLERLDKRAPKLMILLADCLLAVGRADDARAAIEAGLEQNPGHDKLSAHLEQLEELT
ncbi:MAG: tetratricopeptide repeat protein [Pseudomonadota bacterium]